MSDVNKMLGKILKEIQGGAYSNELWFVLEDGTEYKMYHSQSCCESVSIEDITGDLEDLIGSPLLVAEEVSNYNFGPKQNEYDEDYEWTFYKFATIKGSVTIRWYGSSNGYYSTSVSFVKIK